MSSSPLIPEQIHMLSKDMHPSLSEYYVHHFVSDPNSNTSYTIHFVTDDLYLEPIVQFWK